MPKEDMQQALEAQVTRLLKLILDEDSSRPRLFDREDRKAIHSTLWCIAMSDASFRVLLARRSPKWLWFYRRRLQTNIATTIDAFRITKSAFEVMGGGKLRRTDRIIGSVIRLMREHRRLYAEARAANCDPVERLSLLLRMIQLELVWFGQTW